MSLSILAVLFLTSAKQPTKPTSNVIVFELKLAYKNIVKRLQYYCLVGFTLEFMLQFLMSPFKLKFHLNTINQVNAFILSVFYLFYVNNSTPHFLVGILVLKGYVFFNTNRIASMNLCSSIKNSHKELFIQAAYLTVCGFLFVSLAYNSGLLNEQQTNNCGRFLFNLWYLLA